VSQEKKTIEIPKEEYEDLIIRQIEELEAKIFKNEERIAELEKIIND